MRFLLIATMLFTMSCSNIPKYIDIPKSVAESVVPILVSGSPLCSGFAIKPNVFITNAHCCANMSPPNLSTVNNQITKIIKTSPEADLCAFSIQKSNFKPLTLSKYQGEELDKIFTVGYPSFHGKTVREGRIIGTINISHISSKPLYDSSVHVLGGASGSPMFNQKGEVIGVVVSTTRDIHSQFISLKTLKEFIQDVE